MRYYRFPIDSGWVYISFEQNFDNQRGFNELLRALTSFKQIHESFEQA